MRTVWMCTAILGAAGTAFAMPEVPEGRETPVETFEIRSTPQARAIQGWRLGTPEPDELGRTPDERPAILIVAGLDGRHDFGTRVAIGLVDRLVTDNAEMLDRVTVYIIADCNPENDDLFDRAGTPRADFGRAPAATDADRDGRMSEDPGEDLNGDGMITMMRVKDPAPGTGLRAELVIDPDEPRLMRAPETEEGEKAAYALLIEGIDNDGDGSFNEDGFGGSAGGGIDLDRNFPSGFEAHDEAVGAYALSRAETLGLAEWMLTRDNIMMALAYTPGDNIMNTPPTGQFGPAGREPIGIEAGDSDVYVRVKELFEEATQQSGAPTRAWAGSFTQFAYAQFGVWSFSTPAWVRPDLVKSPETEEDDGADEPDARGGETGSVGPNGFDPDAERAALQAQGVPAFVIDFIVADPADRTDMRSAFESMSDADRQARMQEMQPLPDEVRQRLFAMAQGQPDPGPFASAGRDAGGAGGPSGGGEGRAARRGAGRSGAGAARPGGARSSGADTPRPDADDAKWLAYSDETLGGDGFVDWTPFNHPQLGQVEIGGFVPGIRHEPPESEWDRVIDEQTSFVSSLARLMPGLAFETVSADRVAQGVWRVRIRATNPGELPTRSAIGVKARRLAPIVVQLGVDVDDVLAGSHTTRWESIAGKGGTEEIEWVVRAPDGSDLSIDVRAPVYGNRTLIVRLTEGD